MDRFQGPRSVYSSGKISALVETGNGSPRKISCVVSSASQCSNSASDHVRSARSLLDIQPIGHELVENHFWEEPSRITASSGGGEIEPERNFPHKSKPGICNVTAVRAKDSGVLKLGWIWLRCQNAFWLALCIDISCTMWLCVCHMTRLELTKQFGCFSPVYSVTPAGFETRYAVTPWSVFPLKVAFEVVLWLRRIIFFSLQIYRPTRRLFYQSRMAVQVRTCLGHINDILQISQSHLPLTRWPSCRDRVRPGRYHLIKIYLWPRIVSPRLRTTADGHGWFKVTDHHRRSFHTFLWFFTRSGHIYYCLDSPRNEYLSLGLGWEDDLISIGEVTNSQGCNFAIRIAWLDSVGCLSHAIFLNYPTLQLK